MFVSVWSHPRAAPCHPASVPHSAKVHRLSLAKILHPLEEEKRENAVISLGSAHSPGSGHTALPCTPGAPQGALRWNTSFQFDNRTELNEKFCLGPHCCASF